MNRLFELSAATLSYDVDMDIGPQKLRFKTNHEIFAVEDNRVGVRSFFEQPGGKVNEFMMLDRKTLRPTFREVVQGESTIRLNYKGAVIQGTTKLGEERKIFQAHSQGEFLFDGMAECFGYSCLDLEHLDLEVDRLDLHRQDFDRYRVVSELYPNGVSSLQNENPTYCLTFHLVDQPMPPAMKLYINKTTRIVDRIEAFYARLGGVRMTQTLRKVSH